jgi:hypothetical protein
MIPIAIGRIMNYNVRLFSNFLRESIIKLYIAY